MEIVKLDDNILKNCADNQREQAENIIAECVKNGVGIYEIKDNERIFPSNQRMYERLKSYAYNYCWKSKKNNENVQVEVVTRNKKEQILVIVKE